MKATAVWRGLADRLRHLKWVWRVVALLGALPGRADHLVGYDWQFQPLADGGFRTRLTLYVDPVAGPFSALGDDNVTIGIYEQSSPAQLVGSFTLRRIGIGTLPPAAAGCEFTNVSIRAIIYENVMPLTRARFASANGYWLVWERCCRNQAVTNLLNPSTRGMAMLMAFPKLASGLTTDTENNTPTFAQLPPATAFCVGAPMAVSFAASDPEGDSLAYALVPALAGFTSQNTPALGVPNPPPYAPMNYESGFSAQQPLPGTFTIDPRTGLLRGVPRQPGTYGVAVRVEEFRHGRKIGENRRETQLTVTSCPTNQPPRLSATPALPDTVLLGGNDRCLTLQATDPSPNQSLTVRVLGTTGATVAPASVPASATGRDLTICWPPCTPPGPQLLTLIVTDNGCPVATDTLRVPVRILAVPNTPPVVRRRPFATDTLTVRAGDSLQFVLEAFDADADPLQLQPVGAPAGLTISPLSGASPLIATARWAVPCDAPADRVYPLRFRVTDGHCRAADSVQVPVRVLPATPAPALTLANIITPDGDGRNDCLNLPLLQPVGPCTGRFQGIEIYNRWGRPVYASRDIAFCWTAADVPAGTYFLLLRWNNRAWRSMVSVVK